MREHEDSNFRMRRARAADASVIASVLSESFAEYMSQYTKAGISATVLSTDSILARMQEGPVWVAVDKGHIVATISAVPRDEGLYIRGMAVHPRARGRKIGSRLLERVTRYARKNGHRRLYLSTTPFLTRAIRLYEHIGFIRIKEQPSDYYGTPIFRMERILKL